MMHNFKLEAYLIDEEQHNLGLDQTQYADTPEEAELKYKTLDNMIAQAHDAEGQPTGEPHKKYLVRFYLGAYKMVESPSAFFAQFHAN